MDFEEDLERAKKKIRNFVDAASRSGYKIVGFIDKSISTEETMAKWTMRRSEELTSGKRMIMTNMSLFLGSIFKSYGVKVHFSTVDCDDTIAAFAYHLNGGVLSRDCDFFRYTTTSGHHPLVVYFDFLLLGRTLILNRHGGPSAYRQRPAPRVIFSNLPETKSNGFFLDLVPSFKRRGGDWQGVNLLLRRGCGSNLTKLENPHLTARSLRQGLYQEMGYGTVMEIIANWNQEQGKPEFQQNHVQPKADMCHLLGNPQGAFGIVFGEQRRPLNISSDEWRNHVFSQKCVIAELCAWATGANIVDTMIILLKK